MPSEYILSIIITTYNRSSLCVRALESAINVSSKSDENIEIIVVDDGSSDDTQACIQPYISDDIKYYYHENKGAAYSKNSGTKYAKGKYLVFLDSDDLLEADAFCKEVIPNLNGKVDFLYSKSVCIVKGGIKTLNVMPFGVCNTDLYNYTLKFPLNYPGKPSYIFSRQKFMQTDGFDTKFSWGEALYFWRIFLKDINAKELVHVNYIYDQTINEGVSRGRDIGFHNRVYTTIFESYSKLEPELISKGYDFNWKVVILYLAYKNKDFIVIKNLILSLVLNPLKTVKAFKYVLSRRLNRG